MKESAQKERTGSTQNHPMTTKPKPKKATRKEIAGIFALNALALILGVKAGIYTPDVTTGIVFASCGLIPGVAAALLGKKTKVAPGIALTGLAICIVVIALKIGQAQLTTTIQSIGKPPTRQSSD